MDDILCTKFLGSSVKKIFIQTRKKFQLRSSCQNLFLSMFIDVHQVAFGKASQKTVPLVLTFSFFRGLAVFLVGSFDSNQTFQPLEQFVTRHWKKLCSDDADHAKQLFRL